MLNPEAMRLPQRPWARDAQSLLAELDVRAETGLAPEEARRRLQQFGPNRLREARRRGLLSVLAAQLTSVIVWLLGAAALLSLALGERDEALAIGVVIAINTLIGFTTELRAVRSMEGLRDLVAPTANVRRGGQRQSVPAQDLVPGDIVLVEAGDRVGADLRVLEGSRLQASEAALTGESAPVDKQAQALPEGTELAGRTNLLFQGTGVVRGSATGLVVATGMASEFGRIAELAQRGAERRTPLERRLDRLARTLAAAALALVALITLLGAAAGRDLRLVLETAVALAVATIPEGLPIVATLALARGMWRMARRNALVEHLPAVETLGSTNLILTDKTGTLTENRMTVVRIELAERSLVRSENGAAAGAPFVDQPGASVTNGDWTLDALLEAAVLASQAERAHGEQQDCGDPMELALLEAAAARGIEPAVLRAAQPELRLEAFDPALRMMASLRRADGACRVVVKGAPEAVLAVCTQIATAQGPHDLGASERERWLARASELGASGLRLLAVAQRRCQETPDSPYEGLEWLGLVALLDPPRAGVRAALESFRRAGVRVVMVTGDQSGTALHVARSLGLSAAKGAALGTELDALASGDPVLRERLLAADVVARSSPEQKLALLELHQQSGSIVAMIGDGVNDAPVLQRADIGVAMGLRGTQVAREAADLVLRDDRFETIGVAIEEGRIIFDNVRNFVVYLVSCNLSEILVIGLAALLGGPLPILPLQILFLNLVTDVFPALALGAGRGDRGVMRRPPRDPREDFLTREQWRRALAHSLLLSAPVWTGSWLAQHWLGLRGDAAVTITFMILAFAQLVHVFDMAHPEAPVLRNEVTRNPWVWAALALCTGLLLLGVHWPVLAELLGTEAPTAAGWGLIAAASAAPWLLISGGRCLRRMLRSGDGPGAALSSADC